MDLIYRVKCIVVCTDCHDPTQVKFTPKMTHCAAVVISLKIIPPQHIIIILLSLKEHVVWNVICLKQHT